MISECPWAPQIWIPECKASDPSENDLTVIYSPGRRASDLMIRHIKRFLLLMPDGEKMLLEANHESLTVKSKSGAEGRVSSYPSKVSIDGGRGYGHGLWQGVVVGRPVPVRVFASHDRNRDTCLQTSEVEVG